MRSTLEEDAHVEGFENQIRELRQVMLQELRSLRHDIDQLKAALGVSTSAAPLARVAPPRAEEQFGYSPTPLSSLPSMPEDLQKRLQPWLNRSMPDSADERARWLLELSENVEDYLRYDGDEWRESSQFMEQLQQLQDACGLERVVPSEGEPLDPNLHLVLQSLPNPERRDRVARCARPGFRFRGELLRRAEVVVYL